MGHPAITVGEAARRGGVSPKAVRLYETRGILPPAERTESGYRTYTQHDVEILRFVRRARALGLRLEEIRRIVDLERHGAQPCGTVMELLERHLREIDRTMTDLRALRKDLLRTLEAATSSIRRGEEVVVCPIIESEPETDRPTKSASRARGRQIPA